MIERRRSALGQGLAIAYVLASFAGSGLLFLLSIFAVSPTICPDVGGSYLCTSSGAGILTLLGIAVLLALFVGLAVGVALSRTLRRTRLFLAGSILSALLAIAVVSAAAASWS